MRASTAIVIKGRMTECFSTEQRDTVTGYPVRTTWGGWATSPPGTCLPQTIVDPLTGRVQPHPPSAHKPGWTWTGWAGNGGSIMQWCPEKEVGIGYVPNLMHLTMLGDWRSGELVLRVVEAVEKREKAAKI